VPALLAEANGGEPVSAFEPFRAQIEGAILIAEVRAETLRREIAHWERQATLLGELLEPDSTDEDAAEALHWPAAEPRPMTDEELDAAIRSWQSPPLDPPATREEILRQLREHPPGFTSLELQARLALSGPVVNGHLRALRKEGLVERAARTIGSHWVWSRPAVRPE
jgi:DNA-binding transcriptional ArsR family regulator